MTPTVIEVTNLAKKYRIGKKEHYYTLRDSLGRILRHPLSIVRGEGTNSFWALKDVSFSANQGDIVGIIGNNGAGKSTLLKILSRITPPTKGEVYLKGRLGSLLEVGTGFHPELSGRENIYLNGAILGMKRSEVNAKFNEIVEFAEVSKFLDTPMKHYSSGMYTRLAFSVAAHLSSEILLVDEVLAVGDVEFQKKCLGKMGEIAHSGRTILFVSHNMGALQQLCNKAVFLEEGKMKYVGSVDKAILKYLATMESSNKIPLSKRQRREGLTLQAKITEVQLLDENEKPLTFVDPNKSFRIKLIIQTSTPTNTGVVLSIKDESTKTVLFLSSAHLQGKLFELNKKKTEITCVIGPTHLSSGRYSLDCALGAPNRETIDHLADVTFFNVKGYDPFAVGFDYSQRFGVVHVEHRWL